MKDSFFSSYSGQNIASFHPELDVRQFLLPNSERKTASFLQRWTKVSFFSSNSWQKTVSFHPELDERQFPFVLLWTKDSSVYPKLDERQFLFVQFWTKDSFVLFRVGRKAVFFALLVWKKFLEPMIYVFVFGQSFLSEYFSINEFS